MRIIACPKLNKKDADAINLASTNPEKYLEDYLLNDLDMSEDIRDLGHAEEQICLGYFPRESVAVPLG